MKAAVLGSPVSHTLSPGIFAFLSRELKADLSYEAIEVTEEAASSFFSNAEGFVGFNVTIPLKEIAFRNVNDLDPAARSIGAINVIHFQQGKSTGYNTDLFGIARTFERTGTEVSGSACLIWGAGGAARAVAFYLGQQRAEKVYIYNRSGRGRVLAEEFCALFPETSFEAISSLEQLSGRSLGAMINTTPVGMKNEEGGFFEGARKLCFEKDALAFDLIYTPEETPFLKISSSLGLKCVGGLPMLIDQALATWKIWVGPLQDEEGVHGRLNIYLRGLLKLRQDERPIFLTGFMGSGKSTVGADLALLSRRRLMETDRMIEDSLGMTVAEIFEKKGEDFFRAQETLAVRAAASSFNSIVSLGGGTLVNPDNQNLVAASGILIYLEADEKTLNERIKSQENQRPLMKGLTEEDRIIKIKNLLAERKKNYEKAQIRIPIRDLPPRDISIKLLSSLGEFK